MQLKRYTDYALRVLIYLAVHPDQQCSVARIADAYGISRNHLLKVIAGLSELALVTTRRGKHGGLRLARDPEVINVGEVVAHMEGDTPLVDCGHPPCPILAACTLSGVLQQAHRAFLETLRHHTLADLLDGQRPELVRLLNTAEGNPLP